MNGWISSGIGRLRLVTLLEGISWLILLFIAMPLKYVYGQPEWTRIVGTAHGALFVFFLLFLIMQSIQYNWKMRRTFLVFLSSLIPFGFIYADRKYLQEP